MLLTADQREAPQWLIPEMPTAESPCFHLPGQARLADY